MEINLSPRDSLDELLNKEKICQWSEVKNNTFYPSSKTIDKLKSGKYVCNWYRGLPTLEWRDITLDELYVFPNSIMEKVLLEVKDFYNNKEKYLKHNLLHRRGLLLYGHQGNGKTSIVQCIMKYVIFEQNGIVIDCDCDPLLLETLLDSIRKIEPERPVMCIYEDIDAIINNYGDDKILSILDGEYQINYVLNVATSNYVEKLDNRIINRPRRFDSIIKVPTLSRKERELYFEKKIKFNNEEEKNKWLDATEGFSFAALAEMVISVKILEQNFDETVKKLRMMCKNESVKKPLGFGE